MCVLLLFSLSSFHSLRLNHLPQGPPSTLHPTFASPPASWLGGEEKINTY